MARALVAFMEGDGDAELIVHTDSGAPDTLPVSLFFRSPQNLRTADREALAWVRGRTLDVGAGVGSVSLALQESGVDVTAVEVIPEAVDIMIRRGVRDARQGLVEDLPDKGAYETVLALMNGVALSGTLSRLPSFLRALEGLLASGGQILLDSTDLRDGSDEAGPHPDPDRGAYPGELQYQLEFRGEKGAPFPQLFLDPITLGAVAESTGLDLEIVWRAGDGEYLARLTRGRERGGERA
jgi:hypothetical protein